MQNFRIRCTLIGRDEGQPGAVRRYEYVEMWPVLDRAGPRTVGFERIRCRDWRRLVLVDAVDDECYEIGTGAGCARLRLS